VLLQNIFLLHFTPPSQQQHTTCQLLFAPNYAPSVSTKSHKSNNLTSWHAVMMTFMKTASCSGSVKAAHVHFAEHEFAILILILVVLILMMIKNKMKYLHFYLPKKTMLKRWLMGHQECFYQAVAISTLQICILQFSFRYCHLYLVRRINLAAD
jgi:hypothetical protein